MKHLGADGGPNGMESEARFTTDLIDLVERGASSGRGVTFLQAGKDPQFWPWEKLYERAHRWARVLVSWGAGPGTRVAALSSTSPDLVTLIIASWLARTTIIVLPLPLRLGSLERFREATASRVRGGRVHMVFVSEEFSPFIQGDSLPAAVKSFSEVEASSDAAESLPRNRDFLAIIQFTSGSTAEPKGVMVPSAHLAYHAQAIAEAAEFDPETDVVVSWLPLYHDMGLVGLLGVPLLHGASLVLARPQDFVGDPILWMRMVDEYRGTATAGPNFAYALVARGLARQPDSALDLSSLRLALNGAEMIDPALVRSFVAEGGRFGLRATAPFCAYGMAEATLAITFPRPGSGLEVDTVDRESLEKDGRAEPVPPGHPRAKELARLGRPLRGIALRVVDPTTGAEVAERQVGEIQIAGLTVTPGYFENEAATRAVFDGEWLKTGDLGYVCYDGEVVVCGRIKDIIKIGGRTVYPEDIERAVAAVPGVRAGNVIAFGTLSRRGRERVVVVAETRGDEPAGKEALRKEIAHVVVEVAGAPAEDVVLVPPGTLPKTSSGKLQRSACKQMYFEQSLLKGGN
jgi:fatty-acyl-CoA synthase